MTEQKRSFGMVDAMHWDEAPRWLRVGFFWGALLLAAAFCLKTGQIEAWVALIFAFQAGRLVDSLYLLKAQSRRDSAPPTSVFGDR